MVGKEGGQGVVASGNDISGHPEIVSRVVGVEAASDIEDLACMPVRRQT